MIGTDFLWCEKYRPRKVEDCILTPELKTTFQNFVDNGEIPNLLLAGSAGTGKTTVAKAMCEQLGIDYIVINGSMNGGIDTLRNEIKNFASTVSFSGGRKMVILDEADYLNPQSTQPALRNFMEEYSKNCGFIMTCNFKNRIIEPLHSRCSTIEFRIPKSNAPDLAGQFFARVRKILEQENVEYDAKAVAEVIKRYFPDWRRVLNELQRYAATGKIDAGVLRNATDENFDTLVGLVKDKKFGELRKWVAESDSDAAGVMRKFYDTAFDYLQPTSVPSVVLLISKYQYQSAFAVDQEVNLMAFLTEVMVECEFR